jgi:hypothetical protein
LLPKSKRCSAWQPCNAMLYCCHMQRRYMCKNTCIWENVDYWSNSMPLPAAAG